MLSTLLVAVLSTPSTGLHARLAELAAQHAPDASLSYRIPGDFSEGCPNGDDSREEARGPGVKIVIRVVAGEVQKVRAFSPGCRFDFPHLEDVGEASTEESLALVESLLNKDPKGVLAAVAAHQGGEADRFLEGVLARAEGDPLRKDAAFWLGTARGERGARDLARLIETDPTPQFREHVAFCLYVNKAPAAVDALIHEARADSNPSVRSRALFWLGQKASRRAREILAQAARSDEDAGVQKQAVFAISQLPAGEGVPLLIEMARTHPKAEVRKQAMFWLAQSGDTRAVDFFEAVLTSR